MPRPLCCLGRMKTWRLMQAFSFVCVVYFLRSHNDSTGHIVSAPTSSTNEILRYLSLRDTDGVGVDVLDNLHQYKFSMNSKNCNGKPSVVALVHTALYNFKKRQKVRQTLSAHSPLLSVVFFVGQTTNASLHEEVKREWRKYRDVVQGNFIDSYHNMTHKHMMGYHWVITYCKHVRYVIKMDDVVVIHTNNLLRYLLSNPVTDGHILCFLIVNSKRQKRGKWSVSKKEYPFDRYPPYCGGFAYITTLPVIKRLYNASAHVKSIWIDDVYATGILALASNITLLALPKGTRF